VPQWSWYSSPAHPPYDWSSEARSKRSFAHTCREDLSASARAFLAVTDTTNSRSALDLDTVISELRHCKDLQAMIDCDVHTRRGHGWLIPHPPPSLDDAGGRKAAMKLLAAMLAAKTDSSGGLTTMTLGDNLFDGLGSWM